MRTSSRLNFFASFVLFSFCISIFTNQEQSVVIPSATRADTAHPRKIIVDDYAVTNKMLEAAGRGKQVKSGEIYSVDKVWYRNDSLKEVLVFELYTDDYRNIIFHFKSKDVPKELIRRMELGNEEHDLASQKLKEKFFPGFIKTAHLLDRRYFHSNKGFRLGDEKQKALKHYGKPDEISQKEGVEKYEWDFVGDTFYDAKTDAGKKIAIDSYGHQVTMFFRNNKLIGIILHNDIP